VYLKVNTTILLVSFAIRRNIRHKNDRNKL